MVHHVAIVAGMLMLGGAQGQSSMRGYEKFVTPTLQHVKHENGLDTRGEASKIADREEQQAVQKLLADDSMSSISLSAIGIGLLSLVTMLGVRLRRGLQTATILAMPLNTSSALGDNAMEMKSQDSSVKYSAAGAGWGQLSSQNSHPVTPCYANTKADLVELQNSLPGPPGYWDPLDLAESTILAGYGVDTVEANIGWWRHAEIKHGRVAMAAVLGFIAQCTPTVSGEHSVAPYRGYVAGCTPQEQWDNIPLLGKLQIITLIGMLESYGEGAGDPEGYVHYTKGGKPGYYPPIKGRGPAGQLIFNLWDPFEFPGGPKNLSEESKARRLKVELQNGRLAMIGIMGFLAASSVPGSVPFLAAIPGYPQYSGNVMVPFSNDFSLFG